MTEIRYNKRDFTALERLLPDDVEIGTPGLVITTNNAGDETSRASYFLSSHPLLKPEDEILIQEAQSRSAAARRQDDEVPANDRSAARDALKNAMYQRRKAEIDALRGPSEEV